MFVTECMLVLHTVQLVSRCIRVSNKLLNVRQAACELYSIVPQTSQCCVNRYVCCLSFRR
jgi:hypothetical protein